MKHLHVFILFVCFAIAAISHDAEAQSTEIYRPAWSPTNGPFGGSITSFTSRDIFVFAGTASGGVFRTQDQGLAWQPMNTGLPSLRVRGLASNSTMVFAVVDDGTGTLVRSQDNGNTWITVFKGISAFRTIHIDNNNLYIGTETGFYRSTNNGDGLTYVPNNINDIVSITSLNQTILISTGTGGRIVRSTDNGTSVSKSLDGVVPGRLFASGGTIFAGTPSGGVFRSTDIGISWTQTTLATEAKAFTADGTTIFAGTENAVYRSTNNGTTWIQVWKNELLSQIIQSMLTLGSGNGKIHFLGTNNGIYRSKDDGATWEAASNGITGGYSINSIAAFTDITGSDPNMDRIWFAATNGGGVFRTTNAGGDWKYANTGLTELNVNTLLAIASTATLYAGTNGSGVFRSTDKGASWTQTGTSGLRNAGISSIVPLGTMLFAGTSGSGVYRCINNGAWQYAGPTNFNVSAITNIGNTLFAAVYDRNVFRSIDVYSPNWNTTSPENNWENITSNLPTKSISALSAQGTTLYAGTDKRGVFRSTDKGFTWIESNIGLTTPFKAITEFLVSGPLLYASTEGNGIFFSIDSAKTWTAMNVNLTDKNVLSLAISRRSKSVLGTLLAGTSGSGVFQGAVDLTSVHTTSGSAFTTMEGRAFPNPVQDFVTVETSVRANSTVRTKILSLTGAVLFEYQEHSQSTVFRRMIDFTSAPRGTYLLEVEDGTSRFLEKIIK